MSLEIFYQKFAMLEETWIYQTGSNNYRAWIDGQSR